jgi:hypothetical protein
MNHKLKSLGLALVAVLAMSAVVASAAQAVPQFTASAYPATVTGSNTKGAETFTIDGSSIQCDSHFVSHSLNASSSTLIITPTYSGCEAYGFLNAAFNTGGCAYAFHATEQAAAGVYRHHTGIGCPTGKSMKIVAGTCEVEIKEQTGQTTVTTTNLSGGTLTVQSNIVMKVTVTQDGFGCPLAGTGTRNATYHGDVVYSRVGGGSISVSGS